MSNDFFDDLERQLVTATPRRAERIRRARLRRAAAAASAILVLLVGGAGIAAAIGDGADGSDGAGGPDRAPAGATTGQATTVAATTTTPPGPEPYSYEVAILNGTTIPGLGRNVANRLMSQQIRAGQVTNAPRHDVTKTTVYYRSRDCLPAANQVAAALRLGDARGRFTLKPITKAQTRLIGHGPVVVVVAGSDQNRPAGP